MSKKSSDEETEQRDAATGVMFFFGSIGMLQLGVIESKMAIEGRSMQMLIGPNKILQQKVQAQAQSVSDKIANVWTLSGLCLMAA